MGSNFWSFPVGAWGPLGNLPRKLPWKGAGLRGVRKGHGDTAAERQLSPANLPFPLVGMRHPGSALGAWGASSCLYELAACLQF